MTAGALTPTAVIRELPAGTFLRTADLPGTPGAKQGALHRAVTAGLLRRVVRGLYYRGTETAFGMSPPPLQEMANLVLGERGVGPAGYSAARAWGGTTQVPRAYHLTTPRRRPTLPHIHQHLRTSPARLTLNYQEIALLEVLRLPEVYLEITWSEFKSKVHAADKTGIISLPNVLAAATHEPLTVRRNLARLSEKM